MTIIGIKGKSGAGKTTLSRMIKECDSNNIEIIHLDDVWANFKRVILKKHTTLKYDKNNNPIVALDKSTKNRVMSNKIGKFFVDNKEVFINLLVQIEYFKLKKQGKKVIVVEGDVLDRYSISKKCSTIIEVKAPYVERKSRVLERSVERLDKNEMVLRDIRYKQIKRKSKPSYIIKNNGDLKTLNEFARYIYEKEIENKTPKTDNPWRVDVSNSQHIQLETRMMPRTREGKTNKTNESIDFENN